MSAYPSPELSVWLSVIRLAQEDAEGRGMVEPFTRYLAQRWLTTPSRSFYHVCALANIDRVQADFIIEKERKRWKP
jgi:hypothetical protein